MMVDFRPKRLFIARIGNDAIKPLINDDRGAIATKTRLIFDIVSRIYKDKNAYLTEQKI